MRYDRECLYDVAWQVLRVKLLGSWTTVENVKMNIYVLRRYLEAGQDRYERAIRCSNYMAAISLGYGNKPEWAEQKKLVTSAQRMFATFTNVGGGSGIQIWNWDKVQHEVQLLDVAKIKAIIENLNSRIRTSTKRTGGTQYRPELMKFYKMLVDEFAQRQS